MAKKHPSSEQIQSMLREGHFGQSRELPPADPLTATQMLLEIDRIEPYEHNPRKERNPLYNEIKDSIRAQGGLNNPLTITRRPGDTHYIVESGGNTRLQILKELWRETADDRFFRIHCLFRPWVSESHVLTAHLIENDKRGELTFIDKALGVRELRLVLESERGETFSQRQLVDALRERGYALDQSTISRMDYAVDVLLPVIPETLRSGMGAPQIRRIRRLETACRSFWNDQPNAPDRFDALFTEALTTHDGPHWDLDAVQRELETRMAEIAGRFFDKGWIDAPARSGKAPGAFAHPTVPSAHPYVLLNYQGKVRDVMTLAHELGHGVHQVLAGPNGPLMAPTPLTLAETASVFGEMLTFKSLLTKADNPKTRKIMLASKAEDMINTVVRQIAFYTFERKVHTERRNGELTADKIGELWLSVQAESLGPAIKLNEGYETFWTYIPHFIHSPFYVYAYAFGDCLVNSLYAVYEEAETGFQQKYFDLLKAGGTKHHSELLKPFGLDAADPDFWKKGLSVIERLIDELETLG